MTSRPKSGGVQGFFDDWLSKNQFSFYCYSISEELGRA